jgi:hypothetical protein
MHIHRVFAALAVVMLTAVLMVSATSAAPPNFKHATGSVWLSNPTQYVEFSAFDYGATGDRGTVTYTNFEAPAPGSGAWLPVVGTYSLTFAGAYVHTMTITTVTVTSPTYVSFSGTGVWTGDAAYTWTITGSIMDGVVSFHILYTGGPNAGYYLDATGAAATMSGTAVDSNLVTLPWTISPAFAHEVLSYTASLTSVTVAGNSASFVYTIPAGNPYSGIVVTMAMTDGGSPGAVYDTFSIFGSPYTITGGNLVVH